MSATSSQIFVFFDGSIGMQRVYVCLQLVYPRLELLPTRVPSSVETHDFGSILLLIDV
jgi:hypothetical protein